MAAYPLQGPNEERVHTLEWGNGNWLADGDTIASSSWSIKPSTGVTLTDLGSSGTQTSVKVAGLTRGQVYSLTGEIVTTTTGETGRQSIPIRCDFT